MTQRTAGAILDEYLVVQCQLGDADAFGHLVDRWQPRLLRHARCFTRDPEAARDVVQEGWLAIATGLRTLRDPAKFRGWAFRIVANKARDWVRREEVRRRVARQAEAAPHRADTPSDLVDRVRACLLQLEPDQRCVLTWYYLEEMTVAEIAEALDIPVGTVKSRLHYARNALRALLKEKT